LKCSNTSLEIKQIPSGCPVKYFVEIRGCVDIASHRRPSSYFRKPVQKFGSL
jgi:hypothetical protein